MNKNTAVPLAAVFCAVFFVSCASTVKKMDMVEVEKEEQVLRKTADAAATVVATEKAGTVPQEYTVQKGDTLWIVSKKLCGKGSLWQGIAKANNLKEPYLLREKMKLDVTGACQTVAADTASATRTAAVRPFVFRNEQNKTFGVGERLVFAVKYFNIAAGYATLEIKDIIDYKGRKAYHIEATARTAPFFETFYRVKDVITSYMDVLGLFSWRYSKHLEEGGYRNDTSMEFNPEAKNAVKNNGESCDTPQFVQDVLSEFYYFRAIYKGEKELYIDVASDECKSYRIVVKTLRKEKVSTDAGEFDCVVIQPFLKYEGIFKQKGDIWIWLTDDKNLVPVMVKSKIAIGTIDVILQDARVVKAQ
ncbi:MAG: DUF3108 domain-containing protein [Spirochaetia bacterium]|nr:DUF3108 domain-containing protein [Spirochaetia bacterium]